MGFFSNLFSSDFDDPKPMSNQNLLSAIAGQADWLEKMERSPIETQRSTSIVDLTKKRKNYIARMCLELLSRKASDDQLKYPGASVAISVFAVPSSYARELENAGVSRENAAVRAIKEKLFIPSGATYYANWET